MKWQSVMGKSKLMTLKLMTLWLCMLPALLAWSALGSLTAPAWADAYTQGTKSVLVIRVDFSDKPGEPVSDATARSILQQTSDFYKINSIDTMSLSPVTITPVYRMSQPSTAYIPDKDGVLRDEALDAAIKDGFDYRTYDLPVVVWTYLDFSPPFGGKAWLGSPVTWVNGEFSFRILSHEIGHNLSLHHADFFFPAGSDPLFGQVIEYGDLFDTMGFNFDNTPLAHFNTSYKAAIDWLPPSGIKAITASGTYRIQEHDNINAIGLRALTVPYQGIGDYWIEYRRQFDNIWARNGAQLRIKPRGKSQRSVLLDMNPGTSDIIYFLSGSEVEDAALTVGRTFSDPDIKMHVTPTRVIPGAINELEIVVNVGDYPGNASPQVKISASSTQVTVNSPVDFTAEASDPDGDTLAFYWDFDDRTFGPNAAIASKSWSLSGDYLVRCTVSDMKGGVGTATIAIKVGSPGSVRVSGLVLSDCGAPVGGAKVEVASQNKSVLTNSDGTYILTGLTPGTFDVTASLNGTPINPANFTNPVKADFDVEDINFGAVERDKVVPTVSFSKPTDGQIAANLNSQGMAADNQGGCGIERMEFSVQRLSDGKYWNNFGWVDFEQHLSVGLSGTTWSKTTGLPVGKDLDAGAYRLRIEAFDKTLNQAADEVTVTIPEAPVISITKPLNGSIISELATITGTAKDPAQGSLTVKYSVQRLSDNRYFNGSTWVISHPAVAPSSTATYDDATNTWQSSGLLPSKTQLISGAYRVIATAKTTIGRESTAVASFLVDRGLPFVAFTKPVANGTINSLANVTGYAIDNPGEPGATGIAKVVLRIMRNSDKKWWIGTAWGEARTDLPTALKNKQFANGGGVEWSAPANGSRLPNTSETLPGTYTLQAVAYDAAGNLVGTTIQVTLDKAPPSVEIFLPKHNAVVTTLETRGYARDGDGGIEKVTLTMQRQSDGLYWDGTKWSGPTPKPTEAFPTASLLVGSYNGGLIKGFDAASGAVQTTFASGIRNPESIVFGPDQNGDNYPELFVAERSLSRVLFYDGKTREKLGVFAQGGGLIYPTGLAFLPNGDLLVANGHGEGKTPAGKPYTYASFPTSVKRFDSRTRAYLGDFVTANAGGVTNGFEGMCWGNDADGDGVADLYVTALHDKKVPVYSGVDGAVIRDFVTTGSGGLDFPTDVQFGPDNTGDGVRDCYVASALTDDIKLYDGATGAFVRDFIADNDGATFGLNGPERLLFGPDGQLYVSSFGTAAGNAGSGSAVLRFNPTTGAANPGAGQSNAVFATGDLNGPAGLAFNPVATGAVTPPPPGPVTLIIPTLTTNYSSINSVFARGAGLPTGSNLLVGRYVISATGVDKAGNSASHTISVIVGSPPLVSITTPANNSTISSPMTTAGEAKGTAGIARVTISLKRNSDGLYWTGAAWGAKMELSTTLTPVAGGVKWARTNGLPTGSALAAGTYTLQAVATDNNGQTATASSQFTVRTDGGGNGGGSVTVSQTSATASNNTVKLVFTGGLNAQSAANPANYTVTINGQPVAIERAIYSASNNSVLLRPAANTLKPGATVQVTWNVTDSFGKPSTGKTDPFTAAP